MKTRIRLTLLAISLFTASLFALQTQQPQDPPRPFFAKVVRVTDGDTITVEHEGKKIYVRLETIDAPEMTQAFGPQAKKALEDKLTDKVVKVVWNSKDLYWRIRGEVYLDERRLCLEMVAEGFAWHYKEFSKDPKLASAEMEARAAKRGLWAAADPMPPWEYRKRKGFEQAANPADVLVFATKTGKKYHLENCDHLTKTKFKLSLVDALQRNLEPCSTCKPPVAAGAKK